MNEKDRPEKVDPQETAMEPETAPEEPAEGPEEEQKCQIYSSFHNQKSMLMPKEALRVVG